MDHCIAITRSQVAEVALMLAGIATGHGQRLLRVAAEPVNIQLLTVSSAIEPIQVALHLILNLSA